METSLELYAEYTFDNLVVVSSNQFAYAALKAVADALQPHDHLRQWLNKSTAIFG